MPPSFRNLKLRMPAEFEPHASTWLSWPHKLATWPDRFEPIPAIFAEIVHGLAPFETVSICVKNPAMEEEVRTLIGSKEILENVRFYSIPTNDAWARDHGPIFVEDQTQKTTLILDFIFNAWGKKYGPWDLDDVVPQKIAEKLNLPFLEPKIVLEGGSIDVNGQGALLTTEQCLLNKNRNPHLNQAEIEAYLKHYLGVTHIYWLGEGIVGDDTDGHVDDITRFVGPKTLVTALEEDPTDDNFKLLQDNLKRLQKMNDPAGQPFEIVTLPMPGPLYVEDTRLPASYANFYIGNGSVLVPTYRHKNDARALETLAKLFPKRKIVGIDCTDLVWGLGAIHCVTQQQPRG